MKKVLLFCTALIVAVSLYAKGTAVVSDSVSYISVAEALQIGYSLEGNSSTADTFTIVGYVSYLVPGSTSDVNAGRQTFWMTDEQGSTAHTNDEGALRVYRAMPDQEAQVGDKVQVVGSITASTLPGSAQVDTEPYTVTILESASSTGTDPTGVIQDSVSAIKVGDFYYEIQDYGYGAFAELVQEPGTSGYASYANLSGNITIPGSITYNGTVYPVRAIEYQALNGSGISSVTVEEGVEYIYNFAFMDCSSLTTVTLPSTITHMGNQVFGWSGLKTLTINATTPPSHGEREYCLMDASYVEHIYVPASSVAAYKADTVWANHASIIEAIPSATGTDPGTGTTPETGSIIQVGDFYYEIKDYGYGAFAELVKLPGSEEFASYTNLSGDITIPGSITYNGAVYPVSGVGYMSLTGSSAITSVTIGEGVEYIDNFAFMNCSSLTTATLPSTVTSMGNQVFGWSGLKTLTINATTPPIHREREYCLKDASYVEHIYVPASSVDAYKADTVWANHASIIEAIPSATGTDPDSTSSLVPTAMDLLNAGFNPRSNAVLALYFDVAPCNDVVLSGSFNNWSTDSSEVKRFTAVSGFDGWYAVEVPYDNSSIMVKPVQLDNDGSFSWDYQTGDADAWIYKGGDQLSISPSHDGEVTVTIPSLGAYIYEIAYWKNGNSPCVVEENHTYHILLYPPACDSIVPAIRVVSNDWNITPMNPAQTPDGRKAYSYDIVGKEGDYLTFTDAADASNVILRYNSSEDKWSDLGAYVLPAAQEDTTLIYDFSNSERFRWRNCPEDSTATEPVTHNYTIYLMAPQCETVQPGIYGELNNWAGTPMTLTSLGDRNAYVCQVTAAEGSTFMFSDVLMGGDNGILYLDTSKNEWNYLEEITLPQASLDTALFFDFSDAQMYMWADCPKNIKQYTVILIAPECDSVSPAIVGAFDGWKGTPMYEASYGQQKVYMYQVSDEPGSSFKFFDAVRGWANEIMYYDSISGWVGMRDYQFPNIEADSATLVYDLSDASMYCWALCKPEEPVYHHVVLTSNNPNFGAVYGDTILTWPDSVVTIGATAAEGYVFSKWSDGNTDNPRTVIVTTDTAFMAIFKFFKYTITVATNGPTMGTVMGGGTYAPGEMATIMATPYKGCEFVEWSNGSKINPLSFRVYADTMYTAVFRREVPPAPVICSDTMSFTAADTALLAVRIYSPDEIEPYDRFIIAPIDNHAVMGAQGAYYRDSVAYVKGMDISQVAVVTAVPHDSLFRLQTDEGFLTPGSEARNALYADSVGADWIMAQYDSVVIPQTVYYDQRMLLFNETAARFSAYRQLTSIDRRQTAVFKLRAPRVVPVEPVVIVEDTTAWQEEETVMDSITVDVEPQDTVAVITTPQVDYVYSFTLFIWADEAHTQVLLIITYDSEGNQLSVTRPSAVRRLPAASNIQVSFEVSDLTPNTTYHYTLVACEDDGSILTSLNSEFVTTAKPEPSNIGNLSGAQAQTIKFIHNGQLFILRNGKLYNALGVQVK